MLLALASPAPAQTSRASASPSPDAQLDKLAAKARQDLAKYRASLAPVLAMYERRLEQQTELAAARQDLYERGAMTEREVRDGKRALAAAQKDVEDTRRAMTEADRMLGEAHMADVGRTRPLARGQYEETAGLVRFAGSAEWSLAVDTPKLQRFFQGRFGKALPVSAYGQSALHDRMGFDHRNALDVALHPDSPEGRALMVFLRMNDIPFIAAWGTVPGQASGAHIHVGQPSPRLLARR
ncbi:MAG TPA: hypothetical protein VMI34_10275 [Candidatus Bathyarchaeia archaeon]|nr:hypothetical protein [Candidatus Bathyarchaeia archaeon]